MQTEDIKIIYANIKLPVEVYLNGEFKMLYDQMNIQMDMDIPTTKKEIIFKKEKPIKEEPKEEEKKEDPEKEEEDDPIIEEPKEEFKIYKKDYASRIKKRINTTFRKNMPKHNITKKSWNDPTELIKKEIMDYFIPSNSG